MSRATGRVARRVEELTEQRRPFVHATVVRAQCPTSARPGDAAAVLADGSIEGFIGGQCAETSVRAAAVDALARQESILLRILPDDTEAFPVTPGAVTVVNPCLSGGALEIFLEPRLPAPLLVLHGTTPIADALAEFAPSLGFAVERSGRGTTAVASATAVIVASHGRDEETTIRAALDAGVGFIGLVASHKRGAAVLDELALSDEERPRVHSPVGVEIGATTAEEIALSILAAVVRARRVDGLTAPEAEPRPAPIVAVDPVCGMQVTVDDDTPHLHHDGTDHWFCNPGCRLRFADDLGLAS